MAFWDFMSRGLNLSVDVPTVRGFSALFSIDRSYMQRVLEDIS